MHSRCAELLFRFDRSNAFRRWPWRNKLPARCSVCLLIACAKTSSIDRWFPWKLFNHTSHNFWSNQPWKSLEYRRGAVKTCALPSKCSEEKWTWELVNSRLSDSVTNVWYLQLGRRKIPNNLEHGGSLEMNSMIAFRVINISLSTSSRVHWKRYWKI